MRRDIMTVYIDVLLALNLYINYFLIRGTALLLRRDISTKRALAAAGVGAMLSLVILLPELHFVLAALIKALSGVMISLIAFGYRKMADYIIDLLCFLVVSFMYAGLMLALWLFAAPMGMLYRNGSAYFDIPIVAVAAFTAAAYGIVRFLRYLADKRSIGARMQEIMIQHNGAEVSLKAVPDTGNSLTDPFSGTPVIICERSAVESIIPDNIRLYLSGDIANLSGIRLAPCHTVAGRALIPLFRAERVMINGRATDAMIGVCRYDIGAQCIFNPELISI